MKSLILIFIVVLLITNALSVENFKKKVLNTLEDYEKMDSSIDMLSHKNSEFSTLSEKRRTRNFGKNKFLSLAPKVMPFASPEISNFPSIDEKNKLYENFNQNQNTQPTPNLISNQNEYYNKNINNNLSRNTINNNDNFIQSTSYDNSYHSSQYFGNDNNSNNYSILKKNESLQKKYETYRQPEYIHTSYKTVSNFPADENLDYEEFDDPIFLEGKLEDQNKLKVKVAVKVADRFDKVNFAEESKNETSANSQEIVFTSNQEDFNSNYIYSKAKIINEKDSDSIFNNNITSENDDLSKKRNGKKTYKENQIKKRIDGEFANINNNQTLNFSKIHSKIPVYLNKTKNKNLTEIKVLNDKKNLDNGVIYRNINIQGENDFENLENDMKILNFDFLNYINVTDYIKKNKLIRLNLNLNFRNSETKDNSTEINHNYVKYASLIKNTPKYKNISMLNKTKLHPQVKKNNTLNNKTHLEKNIKDFISKKLINNNINASNIHNIRNREIKKIVADFQAEEIKKINKNNTIIISYNNKSLCNNSMMVKIDSNESKKEKLNKKSTELLYKNIDKVSERLTSMFKKVLKDIVLNPSDYILDIKLDNNLSFMREEIKNSLSESIEIPVKNEFKNFNITKNLLKNNEINKKIDQKVNKATPSTKVNKTAKKIIETIKNLTHNFINKSHEINFIQTKSIKGNRITKNNFANNNATNVKKEEIQNLISKKIDIKNKIEFILKKSYSKIKAVVLQANQTISNQSKINSNHLKRSELDHKSSKNIQDAVSELNNIINFSNKTINNTVKNFLINTKVENHNRNVILGKNKVIVNKNKHENLKMFKIFESQKKSIIEIEKEIISQQPKSKNKLEKTFNDNKNNNNSEPKVNLGKIYNLASKQNSKANGNEDMNKPNSNNKTSNISNYKIEVEKNKKDKEIKPSLYLRKEINLSDKTKNYVKNSMFSNLNLIKKDVRQVSTKNLNASYNKPNVKKVEQKHEDMEIDDGSVMAEILKAYKNKLKKD